MQSKYLSLDSQIDSSIIKETSLCSRERYNRYPQLVKMQRTTDHEVRTLNRHIHKTTYIPRDQGTLHVLCHFLLISLCVLFSGENLHRMHCVLCLCSSYRGLCSTQGWCSRCDMVLNPWVGSVGFFCIQQQNEGCYGAGTQRFGPQPEVKLRAEGENESVPFQEGSHLYWHAAWHTRCASSMLAEESRTPKLRGSSICNSFASSRCFPVLLTPLIPNTNLEQTTLPYFIAILYISRLHIS